MTEMDRREFFASFLSHAKKHMRDQIGSAFEQEEPVVTEQRKVRPPGASINDHTFKSLCTGCDLCMAACPINAIMIEDLSCRYPLIYPEVLPCIHCSDYPCIQACNKEALSELNGFNLQEIE